MQTLQSSEVKARLSEFLDDVERGEVIVITRHGRPVAHLVPAPDADRERVLKAFDALEAIRNRIEPMDHEDLLLARHEGHSY